VLLAMVLGAGHALAPGHGKTLMALYLTGRRGSLRDALVVGASVTVTHTVGVFLLAVLLSVSALAAPEALYAWLGPVHGALVVAIGAALLIRRWRPDPDHRHHHSHGHEHGHAHGHGHPRRRLAGLVGFGVVGGLLPSPSALLVLIGAQALGRTGYGVALVLAYGLGMAACLSSVGWLAARGGRMLEAPRSRRHPVLVWTGRRLPALAATMIICSGVFLVARSLAGLP
jgi:nickel/cobalt exporter